MHLEGTIHSQSDRIENLQPKANLSLGKGFGEVHPKDLKPFQKAHALGLKILGYVAFAFVGAFAAVALTAVIIAFVKSIVIISIVMVTAASFASAAFLCLYHFKLAKIQNLPIPNTNQLTNDLENMNGNPNLIRVGEFSNQNEMLLTHSSAETHAWRMKMIAKAEQSIEISGNYCGGELFNEMLDAIENRMKENPKLKVHIMTSDVLLEQKNIEKIKNLRKKYPDNFYCLETMIKFGLFPLKTFEIHTKIFIVDAFFNEGYCITGGTGITDSLCREQKENAAKKTIKEKIFGEGFRDMDVICKGSLAETMRLEYFKLWSIWEYRIRGKTDGELRNHFFPIDKSAPVMELSDFENHPSKISGVKAKLLTSGAGANRTAIRDEYIELVNKAHRNIKIGNLAFEPDEPLREALLEKTSKVALTVITNGSNQNTPKANETYCWRNRLLYHPLMERNPQQVLIHEIAKEQLIYHKKVMSVDDQYTIIGSYNLNHKSDYLDDEIAVSIDSQEITDQLNEILEEDLANYCTKPITLEEAQSYQKGWNAVKAKLSGLFFAKVTQ